jgi:azurin
MKFVLSAAAAVFFAGSAAAKTCDVPVEATDAMQYNTKELAIGKDCKEVKLILKHTGKLPKTAMGHNLVIATDKDMQAVAADGLKAGITSEYLQKGDARVVAATKLVGGGEETSTTFKVSALKAGETYKFFCTFPGHLGIMQGSVVVK